jgi:alpha-aminoadipate carrier protein LysW
MAECPECGMNVRLNDPVVNEVLECDECGTQLVVREINPHVRLEVCEEVDEDWGE